MDNKEFATDYAKKVEESCTKISKMLDEINDAVEEFCDTVPVTAPENVLFAVSGLGFMGIERNVQSTLKRMGTRMERVAKHLGDKKKESVA